MCKRFTPLIAPSTSQLRLRLLNSNCARLWHCRAIITPVLVAIVVVLPGCTRKTAPPVDAAVLFRTKCSGCHRDDNDMRAPEPEALREMSRPAIHGALESGRMKWEARTLSKTEKNAIAEYLGKSDVAISAKLTGVCPRDLDPPAHPPIWASWGVDLRNTRFQTLAAGGIDRERVKALKLKWAFGFPGAAATYGQPTSSAGMVFVGSEDGTVYALDAATGCSWWTFRASATVKTAISIGNGGHTAFFGDTNGYVYAISASDGSLVWRVHPETHLAARITGSPLLVGTTLYVPISSGEEGAAADPHYPCCTFRGAVVALDTASGKQIWKTYAIDETPKPTRQGPQGVQYWGPSGAAIWSSPTADLKRRIIYVATGNNYSGPKNQAWCMRWTPTIVGRCCGKGGSDTEGCSVEFSGVELQIVAMPISHCRITATQIRSRVAGC